MESLIKAQNLDASSLLESVGIDVNATFIEKFHKKVDLLYLSMAEYPKLDLNPIHTVSEGLYSRRGFAKAGTLLISEIHKQENQFVVSQGACLCVGEDGTKLIEAGGYGVTKRGTRRVVLVLRDTIWTAFYPTKLKEIQEIEDEIYEKRGYKEIIESLNDEDFNKMAFDLKTTPDLIEEESRRLEYMTDMPSAYQGIVEVRSSVIEGMGLFSMKDFMAGDIIVPAGINGNRTAAGRFTNHAKKPNGYLDMRPDGVVYLVAKLDLHKGCEITIDYRQAREACKSYQQITQK